MQAETLLLLDDLGLLTALPSTDGIRRAEGRKEATYKEKQNSLFKKGLRTSSCSHEIKRRLLLGRKVMTNLDSISKSKDITLPTKVRLVKAMVFPVVVYGCEFG